MFNVSPGGIANLASALAKAQAEMPVISLDRSVKYKDVKFQYASLANIVYVTKPLLAKFGLTVLQFPTTHDDLVSVETMLLHVSGEFVSSVVSGKLTRADPKELGSMISYLRRYAYASILTCVCDDDLDATIIAERYVETSDQKVWLRDVLKAMNVTDVEVLRKISAAMKSGNYEMTEQAVVEVMESLRK